MRKKLSIYILVLTLIEIFFLLMFPSGIDTVYITNYTVDMICLLLMSVVFIKVFSKYRFDIFQPYFLISMIYIPLFTVVPMFDIILGEFLWFGVDLFAYGVKGTIIAVLGYLVFSFFYYFKVKMPAMHNTNTICTPLSYNKSKVLRYSLMGWIFCFGCTLLYFASAGKGLKFILSLGFLSAPSSQVVDKSSIVGFLSMFTYSLIPFCLIHNQFSDNKLLNYSLIYCTLAIQLLRGFRFIVVVLLVSLVMIYYLKKDQRPSAKVKLIGIFVAVLLVGAMGFYRGAMRAGNIQLLDWSEFSMSTAVDAIIGNFRIYKTYYGIIKAVPDLVPYMFGRQMIVYTLVMFIPRLLWRNKPGMPSADALKVGISEYAYKAGQAYPCVGEFYYEFGVLGVVFFMSMMGITMRHVQMKYLHSKDIFDIMTISIWVPTMLQVIIRGYTPSNFYLIIFLLFPIYIMRRLCKTRSL